MKYSIENEFLKLTADSLGAELVSVINKETGAEMMWNGDPSVWDRHAPILFPYTGKLKNGEYTLDGVTYPGCQHGFMRDLEHECIRCEGSELRFVQCSNAETLARFPREYRFETVFTLEGRRVRHQILVTNTGDKRLRFGIGYHPAFAFPFDSRHTTQDYELRFDIPQSPVQAGNTGEEWGQNAGLVDGKDRVLAENTETLPINDHMFDYDSTSLTHLTAKTLSLVEKDSGRRVTVGIEGFPSVLLWSMAARPVLRFFAIEPWAAAQDHIDHDGDWNKKECSGDIAPGEVYEVHMDVTFDR